VPVLKIDDLQKEYGAFKEIPERYREPILEALSYYPELKNTHIEFRPVPARSFPYGTSPSLKSVFLPTGLRKYIVFILEQSHGPEEQALFRNLPLEAQVGVVTHELGHVMRYRSASIPKLILSKIFYPVPICQKLLERRADKVAINHGAGRLLYKWSVHVRAIPGYEKQSPRIKLYYLKPEEIVSRTERIFGSGTATLS
jgi:hypothetical protein